MMPFSTSLLHTIQSFEAAARLFGLEAPLLSFLPSSLPSWCLSTFHFERKELYFPRLEAPRLVHLEIQVTVLVSGR